MQKRDARDGSVTSLREMVEAAGGEGTVRTRGESEMLLRGLWPELADVALAAETLADFASQLAWEELNDALAALRARLPETA